MADHVDDLTPEALAAHLGYDELAEGMKQGVAFAYV